MHAAERDDNPATNLLTKPLAKASLVGDVAERIRKSVASGLLRPGDAINESQLAERLSISRGTVREAIRVLIGEGLLVKSPNRTARVAELTLEKSWEIYSIRSLLEGLAARILAQRLLPEQHERLMAICHAMDEAANANDRASFADCDLALHEAILRFSGHETLYESWRRQSAWIALIFSVQEYTVESMRATAAEHLRIVAAIASQDPEQAEHVLRDDLDDSIILAQFSAFPRIR